jgi:hypothetical protein
MTTLYFKSPDEHTVTSLRGAHNGMPQIPAWLGDKGYIQIEEPEFKKLKRQIMKSSRGRVEESIEPGPYRLP